MNFLSSVISAFCASCILIGALYMLCPEGNLSKSVKYVLSLSFLVSILAIAGIGIKTFDFEFSFDSQTISSQEFEDYNIKLIFEQTLKLNGIDFEEITIFTDKLHTGGISINKVIIRSDCEKEKISAVLTGVSDSIEVEVTDE